MREYGPGRPLVFSHIPKTAGTSVRVALEETLHTGPPVLGLDPALFGGYEDPNMGAAARSVVFLTPEDLPADAHLVAGHISPASTMARYPGADHMTILRAPQVRLLSHFLHGRTLTEIQLRHWGRAGDAFRAAWLPVRAYLDHAMVAPIVDNTITRFLAWPHPLLVQTEFIDPVDDDELLGAALERLDGFAFVDVAEHATFLTDLGDWLGVDLPRVRLNERTSVPVRRRPDLAAELDAPTRELLDHRVRIDVKVWEHVARRTLPGTDLASLLETSVDDAIQRYGVMLREPDDTSPARRAMERAYELRVRLDPRRRSAIR
jgi:hypothetical protein